MAREAGGHRGQDRGRTKAEVSRDYGVSPRWVYELCRRFDVEGETGLEPRSRLPRSSPQHIPEALEDESYRVIPASRPPGLVDHSACRW